MLANFFDKTKPFNSIILGLIFSAFSFMHVYLAEPSEFTLFYWLKTNLYFFINLFFVIFATYVFIKNRVSNNNLHNTFILILLYCLFPKVFDANYMSLVSFLFLLIYKKLAKLNIKGNKQLSLFDSGIFTGISFLLFDWSILFLVFIFIGIVLAKKANVKNIISILFGCLVPIFLFFAYCFLTDDTPLFIEKFEFYFSFNYDSYVRSNMKTPLITLISVLIMSFLSILPKLASTNGPYRYQFVLAITMLFVGAVATSLETTKEGSEILMIFIPASIIIGRFIKMITNLVLKELFLITLTIISVVILIQNS